MTMADIAAVLRVPLGTAQYWASHDGWDRTRYARPTKYSWDQAVASYERRRTPDQPALDTLTSGQASSLEYDDLCPE